MTTKLLVFKNGCAIIDSVKGDKDTKKYTYLLKSGQYYKVGHTNNLSRRLREYYTHNPSVQVLWTTTGDYEKVFFEKLISCGAKPKWYSDEWVSVPRPLRRLLNTNVSEFFKVETP